MSKSLRIIYAGTPDFSVPALQALHAAGHEIVAVLTQPDRPAGRGRKVHIGPVKQAALNLGLPVLQPVSLRKAHSKKEIRALKADVMIVAAYGLILPQSVLDMPRLGCLNIHASLLPRWRGAAPIHRAIEAGDEVTGITIMQMDVGLDTGDMLSMHPINILKDDTSQSLHDKLSECGAEAIVETLAKLEAGLVEPQTQDEALVTYAQKDVDRPVGKVIKSSNYGIQVQTGRGILNLLEVQMSGKKRLAVEQFVNATDLSDEQFSLAHE